MKTRLVFVSTFLALGSVLSEVVSSGVVECPLSVMHTRVYLPVNLNGRVKPNWWLVDTGAPWSWVDAEKAKQLLRSGHGLAERWAVISGEKCKVLIQVEATVSGYHLGRFDFVESPLVRWIDRNHLQDLGFSHPFDTGGVLGLNFLVRHGALLDFGARQLFLAANNASLVAKRTRGFTHTPVRVTPAGRIEVVGSVGANIYSFLIDSGSGRTVLTRAVKEDNQIPVRTGGAGYFSLSERPVRMDSGELPSFKLGTQDISQRAVQFADLASQQNGFSHAFGGIIGEDILWRHEAILDLGERALYLKPSP